jgi:hypothetical protein
MLGLNVQKKRAYLSISPAIILFTQNISSLPAGQGVVMVYVEKYIHIFTRQK